MEGVEEGVIEHLAIRCQEGGKYTISGQVRATTYLFNNYCITEMVDKFWEPEPVRDKPSSQYYDDSPLFRIVSLAIIGNARLDSGSNPAFPTLAYDTIEYTIR